MIFLFDILSKITDWPVGTILAVVLIVCILMLAFLTGYGIYIAIGSWWQPINTRYGKVVNKKYTPAHTNTIWVYNASTKTSMPIIQYFSDNYEVYVEINNLTGSMSVSQEFYEHVDLNDDVMAEYKQGRLNRNNIYIVKLWQNDLQL